MLVCNARDDVNQTAAPELMPGMQVYPGIRKRSLQVHFGFVLVRKECHNSDAQLTHWQEPFRHGCAVVSQEATENYKARRKHICTSRRHGIINSII